MVGGFCCPNFKIIYNWVPYLRTKMALIQVFPQQFDPNHNLNRYNCLSGRVGEPVRLEAV